jgi:hypothetical protein
MLVEMILEKGLSVPLVRTRSPLLKIILIIKRRPFLSMGTLDFMLIWNGFRKRTISPPGED